MRRGGLPLISVDSNIPMYLIGAPHPHKADGRRLSSRDALHLAVMQHHGIGRIMSFDAGFDGFPGIARLG